MLSIINLHAYTFSRKRDFTQAGRWSSIRAVTSQNETPSKVNWSIKLDTDLADLWDELLYSLRRETGRRTLNKADILRALVELASDEEAPVRSALIGTLSHERA